MKTKTMKRILREVADELKNNGVQFVLVALKEDDRGHVIKSHTNVNDDHHMMDIVHHVTHRWSVMNHPLRKAKR